MRRLLAAMLLFTACAAAGCGPGTAKPPAPVVTPELPPPVSTEKPALAAGKVEKRTVFRSDSVNHGLLPGLNEIEAAPEAEVIVGPGEVMVSWWGDFASNVKAKAVGATYDQTNQGPGVFQVHFPAGGAERWEVSLEGVPDSRIILVRKPEPTVQIAYQRADGTLAAVPGNELAVPPGGLTLDLRFDQPMKPESLTKALEATWGQSKLQGAPAGVKTEWVAPDHAWVTFASLPARLDFALDWLQGASGLFLAPHGLLVRTTQGEPYLERLNVVTGAKERLMAVPADIIRAQLAPGGKYLAFSAHEKGPDSHPYWPVYTGVVDLAKSELQKLQSSTLFAGWRTGESVLVARTAGGSYFYNPATHALEMEVKTVAWAEVTSPDGKYLARFGPKDFTNVDYDKPNPEDLFIEELGTGRQEVVRGFVSSYVFGKDGFDATQWVAWSPDSRKIAALDPTAKSGGSNLVVYDRETGERKVLREGLQVAPWGVRLAWSPDGKNLLLTHEYQAAMVLPLTGGKPVMLPNARADMAFWDSEGARVLSATEEWKGVYVYQVENGRKIDLGDGLPAGWDGDWAYVVRWPASDTRYVYQGI